MCACFSMSSTNMAISNDRVFFWPMCGWEMESSQYLNNHYETDNCQNKSDYSKLHDRVCHITESFSSCLVQGYRASPQWTGTNEQYDLSVLECVTCAWRVFSDDRQRKKKFLGSDPPLLGFRIVSVDVITQILRTKWINAVLMDEGVQ